MSRADPAGYAAAVVDVFARYNVWTPPAADLAATAERYSDRVVAALVPRITDRRDASLQTLVLCHVAERVALALTEALLPTPLPPMAERALAADHAVAALHALGQDDARLRARLAATANFLRQLPAPTLAQLPVTARELGVRLGTPGPLPFEALLARSYPHTFDRDGARILWAMPRARVCTLRTVEAPIGTLATPSADGHLWLATPRALREVASTGPELRRTLNAELRPGTLLFAGPVLTHLTAFGDRLEATLFNVTPDAAVRQGVVVVRGTAFLDGAGALLPAAAPPVRSTATPGGSRPPAKALAPVPAPPPLVLAVRRVPPGYEEIAIDLAVRRARRIGAVPGSTGHRDGPMGEARFLPGPFTTLSSGARVFYDPAARALRIAAKGFVGTLFTGPDRKDGSGPGAGVGTVTGLSAGADGQIYLAERGRPEAGFQRFHLRVVRLQGQPCP